MSFRPPVGWQGVNLTTINRPAVPREYQLQQAAALQRKMHGGGLASITAHCLHCKANRRIVDPRQQHTGHHYFLIGRCAVCGNKLSRPIPDPRLHGQKGGGILSSILGDIPGIGAIAGPIAGALGLGEELPKVRVRTKHRSKKR